MSFIVRTNSKMKTAYICDGVHHSQMFHLRNTNRKQDGTKYSIPGGNSQTTIPTKKKKLKKRFLQKWLKY